MKKLKLLFIFISFILLTSSANAQANKIIKLAILDSTENFSQNFSFSKNLRSSYLKGIIAAKNEARKEGYEIHFKPFFFDNNLVDMMNKISEVKFWQPDVIIGMHQTNELLMSKNFFDNIMVISLFATDYKLMDLPKNFYSIAIPDRYIAEIFQKLVSEKLKQNKAFLLVAADNKESEDMSYLMSKSIEKYKDFKIQKREFIEEDVPILNIKKLMKDYRNEKVIIILCSNYSLGSILMSKISHYLHLVHPFFIVDFDNWGGKDLPTKNLFSFRAYRVTPYLMQPNTKNYHNFLKIYSRIFNELPADQISYQSFSAVMSIIRALKLYPDIAENPMRKKILKSYELAIYKHPHWFQQNRLWIYKMTPGKDKKQNFSYPLFNFK